MYADSPFTSAIMRESLPRKLQIPGWTYDGEMDPRRPLGQLQGQDALGLIPRQSVVQVLPHDP